MPEADVGKADEKYHLHLALKAEGRNA